MMSLQTIIEEQVYFVSFKLGNSTYVSVECKYNNQPEIEEEQLILDARRKVKEDLGLDVEHSFVEIT